LPNPPKITPSVIPTREPYNDPRSNSEYAIVGDQVKDSIVTISYRRYLAQKTYTEAATIPDSPPNIRPTHSVVIRVVITATAIATVRPTTRPITNPNPHLDIIL